MECASKPCKNGGTCKDGVDNYTCSCRTNYHGENCEDYDNCAERPCKNGGTCTDTPDYWEERYECTCPSWLTGINCEADAINQCGSSPCKPWSTCIDEEFGYWCSCPPGMNGQHCETDIDECASMPCVNGATCENLQNGHQCICPPGRAAPFCEEINECESEPCQNDGSCTNGPNAYTCTCQDNFTGASCEYKFPGEPDHTCPTYITEHNRLLCGCITTDWGVPRAVLQWTEPGDVKTTLDLRTVRRDDAGTTYTCRQSWAPPGIAELVKETLYTLQVAYGPTDDDSRIERMIGPDVIFESDGVTQMNLTCSSNSSAPTPHITWSGVNCQQGNLTPNCTFKPDPSKDNGLIVTCSLRNPQEHAFTARASYKVSLKWSGNPKVLHFLSDKTPTALTASDSSTVYTLVCLGFGRPKPEVSVYLLAKGNASSSTEKDERQLQDGMKGIGDYRQENTYTVRSPASCEIKDVYRCDVRNDNGNDSKFITIASPSYSLGPQYQPRGPSETPQTSSAGNAGTSGSPPRSPPQAANPAANLAAKGNWVKTPLANNTTADTASRRTSTITQSAVLGRKSEVGQRGDTNAARRISHRTSVVQN